MEVKDARVRVSHQGARIDEPKRKTNEKEEETNWAAGKGAVHSWYTPARTFVCHGCSTQCVHTESGRPTRECISPLVLDKRARTEFHALSPRRELLCHRAFECSSWRQFDDPPPPSLYLSPLFSAPLTPARLNGVPHYGVCAPPLFLAGAFV